MAEAIHEKLVVDDAFSATFTKYLRLGNQAADASILAAQAAKNYQSVLGSLDKKLINANSRMAANIARAKEMKAAGQQQTAEFYKLEAETDNLRSTISRLTTQYAQVSEQAIEAEAATRALTEAQEENAEAAEEAADSAGEAAASQGQFSENLRGAIPSANGFVSSLKKLAAAYISVQGAKKLIGLADTFTQTETRLNAVNDGLQTTEELNQMIYASAQRSRSSYSQMLSTVSQLGTAASSAFNSNAEMVAFAEQLNKQLKLSGTTAEDASSVMTGMQTALMEGSMTAGELNQVLKQAPTIAQTLAEYMGTDVDSLRDLASQGQITSDVIRDALLGSAEDVNAKFAEMPMTFAEAGQMLLNVLQQSIQPALQQLTDLLNSPTGQQFLVALGAAAQIAGQALSVLVSILSNVANFIASNFNTILIAAAIIVGVFALQMLASAIATAAANWPLLLFIAAVVAVSVALSKMGATASDVFEGIGAVAGWLYAFVYNLIADAWNIVAAFAEFFANVFDDPLGAVAHLFFDIFDAILGVVETVADAIDTLLGTNMAGAVAGFRSKMGKWVDDKFGENAIKIERMAKLDSSTVSSDWGAKGRSLGESLEGMSLGDLMGGFDIGTAGGGSSYGGAAGGNGSLGGIASDVSDIKDAVDMSNEDIQSLVDMAERRYVNNINLTSQAPVIQISGQNTGNTEADKRNLADTIRDIVIEQVAAGTTRSVARV